MSKTQTTRLLAWYDAHARALPWRAPPGARPRAAYEVWLSEVMLQQTTVAAVGPYFAEFLRRWPRVEDLAAAPVEEVLKAWAGLGYYTRARKLHECARVLAGELGGRFPERMEELQALPGIGPYTAAAISAIAFGRPAPVVDGNIERVIARAFAVEEPLPGAKAAIKAHVAALMPADRPGDFAQAMMDLGASVCSPKRPSCLVCPWTTSCLARARGIAEDLPRKAPKPERPTRAGAAFWVERADGHVLLRRRPDKGLLGGMVEIPSTQWIEGKQSRAGQLAQAPLEADYRKLTGRVEHTFTHFHLQLDVYAARVEAGGGAQGALWTPRDEVLAAGLPTVMKKIAKLALKA